MILLPQMLKALVRWLKASGKRVEALKFVAVGGARTAAELILEARALGLPVYEGYGLSECCSVVALNLPARIVPAASGGPCPAEKYALPPPAKSKFAHPKACAIWVSNDPGPAGSPAAIWAIDKAGFLMSTAAATGIGQCFRAQHFPRVGGERVARASGCAASDGAGRQPTCPRRVLVATPGSDKRLLTASVNRCNASLPDYARIAAYRAVEPFSVTNGQLTPNGRIRRKTVLDTHRAIIKALHQEIEALFAGGNHDLLPQAHRGN